MKFEHFVKSAERIRNKVPGDKPTPLRISTMTVRGGHEGVVRPLNAIKEHFSSPVQGWEATKSSFNNSVSIAKTTGEGKKAKKRNVKFFRNGVIHLTGCSTPDEAEDIIKETQILVSKLFNETEAPKTEIKIDMINASFKVPNEINPMKLIDLYELNTKYVSHVSMNPESYPAVKARMFNLTVSVFKSGSVLLAGAKNFKDILYAYDFLTKKLYDEYVLK